MSKQWLISRRTVLRGLGTAVSLPWLEAMIPLNAYGSPATDSLVPPKRMAFLFIPNGVHMPDWKPQQEGTDFELPRILQPLAEFKNDFNVLTGLAHDKARPNGDGPGDHARCASTFLTGAQAKKTSGADIYVGVSVDQYAATRLGSQTRLPSLELGIERGAQAGNCDSGYSCAYSSNIAWKTPTQPLAKEVNPQAVFDRLFSANSTDERQRRRNLYQKSVLDFVLEDAARLRRDLGANDARKLDEYLSSVRELEQRIGRSLQEAKPAPKVDVPRPTSPKDYEDHVKLMCDLMALAFQTDQTRIVTFMFGNAGSNRAYPWLDVPEGHHDLSHHGRNADKQEKISRINQCHARLFAYLLQRLKETKDPDGSSVLDNSLIVYGSAIGDGDRHNHDDLPVVLAGRAGGAVPTGRHIVYSQETPMANLFVTMLDLVGVPVDRFGDSTGPLDKLVVS